MATAQKARKLKRERDKQGQETAPKIVPTGAGKLRRGELCQPWQLAQGRVRAFVDSERLVELSGNQHPWNELGMTKDELDTTPVTILGLDALNEGRTARVEGGRRVANVPIGCLRLAVSD